MRSSMQREFASASQDEPRIDLSPVPSLRAVDSVSEGSVDSVSGLRVTGRIKWFDATRGFGFLVSDAIDGDVLVHFSVLREHNRRSLPEGAVVTCDVVRQDRGL